MRTLRCWWLGLAIVVAVGRASGREEPPPPRDAGADLAEAHRLLRFGQFAQAGILFRRLGRDPRQSPPVVEEARYLEAECLERQGNYPAAAVAYCRLLKHFPAGACQEQAVTRLFQIANYWLDDTREQMHQGRAFEQSGWASWLDLPGSLGLSLPEARSVFRWALWCLNYVHWDRTRPALDEEGRALECLRLVHDADPAGPRAEQALFMIGSVRFYREEYPGADRSFSRLIEEYPDSMFAAQAIQLAILSKVMQDARGEEEGRRLAAARQLVEKARRDYPDIKGEFLDRQFWIITRRQAAREVAAAERWERAGRPDLARARYLSICQCYPGTPAARLASDRLNEPRTEGDKTPGKR